MTMVTTSARHRREGTDPATLVIDAGAASGLTEAPKTKQHKTRPEKPLYTDGERERLQQVARSGGVKAVIARSRLDNDGRRREERELRAERPVEFAVPTLARTDTGFAGRGGGRMPFVRRPTEFRGTTAQVPGLYPFSVGANAPLSGAPIGTHLETGQPVGYDGLSWFLDGDMTAPSTMTLGLNGFGKSTFGRRIALYDLAVGVRPMVMGDLKPDFTSMYHTINELSRHEYDGHDPLQVSEVGYGGGKMNPLDVGNFGRIIARLPQKARQVAEVELRRRQITALCSLLQILRGAEFQAHEETLVGAAIDCLYRADANRFDLDRPPLPEDVLKVLKQAPQGMHDAAAGARHPDLIEASGALGRTADLTWDRYIELTERLRQALDLIVRGPFGTMFNAPTTNPIDTEARGVCVDISKVPTGDTKLRAAVLLTSWSDGFSAVEAAHLLSDHGLQAPRLFDLFVDEFSLVLGLGHGMVYRVDEITRVQRTVGTGTNFFTHTLKDLTAFDSQEDRSRALGFFDRARAKVFFPLPQSEAELLEGKVNLNDFERNSLAEWASAPRRADDPVIEPYTAAEWRQILDGEMENAWATGRTRGRRIPPGMGKLLIKTGEGEQPGIPLQMSIAPTERRLGFHNTNRRFDHVASFEHAQQER